MKKIALLLAILSGPLLTAQKNNSLLWEISGNGLSKNSYLYGTMHVSDKVSYHLSDAFFKHLMEADIVSNESDPESWEEFSRDRYRDNMPEYYSRNYKFYSYFYLKPIEKETLKYLFTGNSYYAGLMSLNYYDDVSVDYQESNVLDMFIYQTGRKYKKRIVGLENAKKSMQLFYSVTGKDARPKDENKLLALKIMKNRPLDEAMKDLYREKDIVMLDSLSKLTSSEKSHEAMIVKRNITMARSIDSLAKTGSVFAAVGAAHLAGKQGIIDLLRAKGYTLKPVIDSLTNAGKKQKKIIEEYFPEPELKLATTRDNMISMPMTKNIRDEDYNIESPDYTNGGVTTLRRVPLNYFMKKDADLLNPKSLDSLFYEGIAGNILEKKYFEQENFSGYDIRNITKTGNTQHSRFYITPLEIIVISMTGKGDYVKQYENRVFDNIKIKAFKKDWDLVSPKRGGFEALMPSFASIFGANPDKSDDINIQAYDPKEKGSYFLSEKTLSDLSMLEESEYEHKQIHYEFYMQHSADTTETRFDKNKNAYESASTIGTKKIRLKSIIKGNKYYLLGTVNASNENTSRFFESFSTKPWLFDAATKVYTDTIAQFSITVPEKQNRQLFSQFPSRESSHKNIFEQEREYYNFNSETGQSISMAFVKNGKYERALPLDSIRKKLNKEWLTEFTSNDTGADSTATVYDEYDYDYSGSTARMAFNNALYNHRKGYASNQWNSLIDQEKDNYEFVNQSQTFDEPHNRHVIDAVVSKPNATQAIRYRAYVYDDRIFTFSALTDKIQNEDTKFMERTMNSLERTEKSKFSDSKEKIQAFIDDANNPKDTIRYSALSSADVLELTKKDFPAMRNFLKTFTFNDKESEKSAKQTLLAKLISIESPEALAFADEFYRSAEATTTDQLTILRALATHKSKAAYTKIRNLMEYDLPLPQSRYEIVNLFTQFKNNGANSRHLFPAIFEFYSIPEYNEPILDFAGYLLDKDFISSKTLKSYRKMIVTNAKLECKRMVTWKQNNPETTQTDNTEEAEASVIEEYTQNDTHAPSETIISYLELIYSLPQDNQTTALITKIKALDIPELNTELMRLDFLNDKLGNDDITKLLHNPQYAYPLISLLANRGKNEQFAALTADEMAVDALTNFNQLTPKDPITIVSKRTIDYRSRKVTFYFFSYPARPSYRNVSKKEFVAIAFINDANSINPLAYKVFNMQAPEDEEKDLERRIQSVINAALNEKHTRASFEKEDEMHAQYFWEY
ncbi:TraB/GumN family protein [Flavobacterium sp.]|uniref:TraB/GumN family protein n=1 Tax=Flavobacterium sp. TaxID=239 RepID=UPI002611AFFB|nr:TraB/GumN family protein [Flavobacterium sp.]